MTICLLLAAGSSSRMGKPKMLLPDNGKTFLQHAIDEIKKVKGSGLLVVTGCYHELLESILSAQQIAFVENKNWEKGIGPSIQEGVKYIVNHYSIADNIIILVCDQPYISSALLNELIETKQQSGKGIIASAYNGTMGTPVLFDKKYFEQLALLNGQYGAKKIIQANQADVAEVAFPLGAVDIDTEEDYEKLHNNRGKS